MLNDLSCASLNGQESTLEQRFRGIDRFDGMNYADVLFYAGSSPKRIVSEENTFKRTWIDGIYSICLLFDEQDVCLGVWEERIE